MALVTPDSRPLPRLSVVVDNYNYAPYLREALDSALPQLAPGDELIVVDDGSSDGSREILAGYAEDPRVHLVLQENQGQLAAIFNGLARAGGDLCLLLDSDDYFLPGYLQRVRQQARDNPQAALFFCSFQAGGENPRGVAQMRLMQERMRLEPGPTGRSRCSALVLGEYLGAPTSGLALRRSFVELLLSTRESFSDWMPLSPRTARWVGMPPGAHTVLRLGADGIIVRAASIADLDKYHDPEPGFFYRIHGGNAFASMRWWGRIWVRLRRNHRIAGMTARALSVDPRPALAEVVAEAGQRSRPRYGRRRLRLRLNYVLAVLMARAPWWRKPAALGQVLCAFR